MCVCVCVCVCVCEHVLFCCLFCFQYFSYVMSVLHPECLIRMIADVHGVDFNQVWIVHCTLCSILTKCCSLLHITL